MKKIAFISDFFKKDILGGAESNDDNLINHLKTLHVVKTFHAFKVSVKNLEEAACIILGNFATLNQPAYDYIIKTKKHIIYEHDHKYIKKRNPSIYPKYLVPKTHLVNIEIYEKANHVVVLSEICKDVIKVNVPKVNVHSIGCSLWSENNFKSLEQNTNNIKDKELCIFKSSNPIKNYSKAVHYCKSRKIKYGEIGNCRYEEFLESMSRYKKFLFIPGVLETYSRICAEAKMLGLDVLTSKMMIGFFSEKYSNLKGIELIKVIKQKNKEALDFFESVI